MRQRDPDGDLAIADALDRQAGYCRALGAPRVAGWLERVATGPAEVLALLPPVVRAGDLMGLRVLAALHRLVLDAVVTEPFDPVVALLAHPDVLADALARVPQTNDPGRSRALRVALSEITGPVRLFEVGASAGLNLRADHLPGDAHLEIGPMPGIVERRGCDLEPIDPTSPDGVARLESYVWVDHVDRLAALRAACAVARAVPAEVVAADAVEFVRALDLVDGTTTVLWHSAFTGYLDAETYRALIDAIAALGGRAAPGRAFRHVAWESQQRERFVLTVDTYAGRVGDPDRRELLIGTAHGGELVRVGGDG